MPPLQRRPRQVEEDADDQERPRQRQRRVADDEYDGAGEAQNGEGEERDEVTETLLAKKLVRYALACEYSRTPIRRDGIREKVLGPAHSRSLKKVFDCAQKQLRAVFGMEMVELPVRDKSTMSVEEQRRAAKSQSRGPTSSGAYILVTTLSECFRTASIIAPSRVRSSEAEATQVALYSLIVTMITLNRGELSDQKLRRYLQRMNANVNTPIEKTELLLQRLIRQGYLIKTVEKNPHSDEDTITWHVGPRGKQEVTNEAMASIVRQVYGDAADDELERKIGASLRVADRKPNRNENDANGASSNAAGRQAANDDDSGDEEQDDG